MRRRRLPAVPDRRRRSAAASATAAVVVAATLAGAAGASGRALDGNDGADATIEWTELGPGVEEGTFVVPIDRDHPDSGTFQLHLARHLATDQAGRIGTLVVNAGGPGFGSSNLALQAEQSFAPEIVAHFDIVGFDPRGTGRTVPTIDCIDDADHFYGGTDITPDDDAERDQLVGLAREYADACVANNADIIQFVGTNDVARDIDAIRRALGEDTLSYFGFSYGSELGATWATLFPDTVRAAVLDGAVDPTTDSLAVSLQQAAGFERALTAYLAACSDDPGCAFHNDGDAEGAFDHLMATLDDEPIASVEGRPDITRGLALVAVRAAMYGEVLWPQLSAALADAQAGDGSGLLALYDGYYERNPDGTWADALEAYRVITCMDTADRSTVEQQDHDAEQIRAVAPRVAPGTTGSYNCTFFPPPDDPRVPITGRGAGPIVVCAVTGDPVTPLEGGEAMASTLEGGRLVIVEGDQHTCYGLDECADGVIEHYLVELAVPPPVTDCRGT